MKRKSGSILLLVMILLCAFGLNNLAAEHPNILCAVADDVTVVVIT